MQLFGVLTLGAMTVSARIVGYFDMVTCGVITYFQMTAKVTSTAFLNRTDRFALVR
jgi:hypothetical protein